MCSVSKDRVCCCLLLLTMLCACARQVCAQRASSYLLQTAEATSSSEPYRISFSTSSRAVTFSFPLGGPSALNLRAEYFRVSSLPKIYEKVYDIKADWKFRSIPITASYTYAFPSPTSRVVPVAGIGVSAHFYRETRRIDDATGMPFNLISPSLGNFVNSSPLNKIGLKLGAEASLGLRTQIGRHAFIMTEARYRYINCSIESMRLYGNDPLNVVDFNVDFGFTF